VSLQEFLLFLVSIVAGVSGQFFLKSGALKLAKVTADNFIGNVLSIATTPDLIVGLTFYGLAAILYIMLLTRVNLSVLAPAVALQYIFSVLMGHFLFHEAIPLIRIVGIGLIICGVVLLISKN
jgi:drug/metabolite transporter (DMT)-like permease